MNRFYNRMKAAVLWLFIGRPFRGFKKMEIQISDLESRISTLEKREILRIVDMILPDRK